MKLRATNAALHLLFNCPCFVVGGWKSFYFIEYFNLNSDRSGVLNCAFSLNECGNAYVEVVSKFPYGRRARCAQRLRYK